MYPFWQYYPRWQSAPVWVSEMVGVFADCRTAIDTGIVRGANGEGVDPGSEAGSNRVLRLVTPGLRDIGFQVEWGKVAVRKLPRPVFFGENGTIEHQYEIDAYNSSTGVSLEVEAGRAWQSNAIYRDIVQISLMIDVRFGAVAVPLIYRYRSSSGRLLETRPYEKCQGLLDTIYGGRRLELPLEGFLLLGY
jgi:hypothetical protein